MINHLKIENFASIENTDSSQITGGEESQSSNNNCIFAEGSLVGVRISTFNLLPLPNFITTKKVKPLVTRSLSPCVTLCQIPFEPRGLCKTETWRELELL